MKHSVEIKMRGLSWIASFGMAWNFLGVVAFVIAVMATREGLQSAGTGTVQIDYVFATPLWAKLSNAIAVFAGFAGSVALFMRRRVAYGLCTLSLLAIMVVMLDTISRNGFSYLGPVNNGIYLAVILIGLFLFWIAHRAHIRGVLG